MGVLSRLVYLQELRHNTQFGATNRFNHHGDLMFAFAYYDV